MFSSNASQVSNDVNYIESVFQTHLYTGNGTSQTINNGIDLAGKGGLVWTKNRAADNHALVDTIRGKTQYISSNTTDANASTGGEFTNFLSDGYSLLAQGGTLFNSSPKNYASWTFRKQPKFFDVVTYTTVSGAMTIPHNLGSTPGCWIIKATNAVDSWWVHHRSIPTGLLRLEGTSSSESSFSTATSTNIAISNGVFAAGTQIVIYLFAHDAGGFGLSGNENVVSCGSFTTDGGGGVSVNLGYEPQWLMFKAADAAGPWFMVDNMRGFSVSANALLRANTSGAETTGTLLFPSATGFYASAGTYTAGVTYIYIAIRRGPMAVPTLGTTVFSPNTATYSTNQVVTTGFPVDLALMSGRTVAVTTAVMDRLRGLASNNVSPINPTLFTDTTAIERTDLGYINTVGNTGYQVSGSYSGFSSVNWNFRRAPSFFDEVCYTGTGNPLTLNHNLGVAPELVIYKSRSNAYSWIVQSSALSSVTDSYLVLNGTNAQGSISNIWRTPTATTFGVALSGNLSEANYSGATYVAYLFATCAGVSKVGSYTGTGTTQAINCGFTAGARFVLIKRTDSAGDWYVWDSTRGIVANSDPYLLLNSTAAEVTGTDYIDPVSSGFEISSTAPAAINASGGSYIFLAVA